MIRRKNQTTAVLTAFARGARSARPFLKLAYGSRGVCLYSDLPVGLLFRSRAVIGGRSTNIGPYIWAKDQDKE